jgi:hypothetical protein
VDSVSVPGQRQATPAGAAPGTVPGDHTATRGPASLGDDAVERAFAAAIRDVSRVGELLDVLSQGRLWLPLPADGRPVTDGSAVSLPTVTYLGSEFVPAFTSADRLLAAAGEPALGPPPHMVVRAADLARLLPAPLGIALNPGGGESVPVYPEGVAYLASVRVEHDPGQIRVGPVPAGPLALLAGIGDGLALVRLVRQAAAAWLSVESAGEGLIISVTLDDPADCDAQQAVITAVEQAAMTTSRDADFPIDVTFPGEGDPDVIDSWVSAFGSPFYQR